MKPSAVLLSSLFGIAALVGIVAVARLPQLKSAAMSGTAPKPPEELGPPISPTGPYPKAVADNTEFNFGVMPVLGEGTHTFTIRNEGDADLVLVARKEDRTCQCTGADLDDSKPIPPGKSTDITLHWKIKVKVDSFRHSATIRTNDPKNKTIKFEITGEVQDQLVLKPQDKWELGEIASNEPTKYTAQLYSGLVDDFAIESIQSANPLVSATWEPLTDEEKQELKAKSGYTIHLTVAPGVAIGLFSDTVKITTSLEAQKEIEVKLSGNRPGPVEFFGPGFVSEYNMLRLGEFAAKDGKSAALTVHFRDFNDEVKLLKSEQKYNSCELEFEPVRNKSGAIQRYLLKIKVPPGPPQDRQRKESERIDLYFNHPGAEHVKLIVDFLAVGE